MRISTAFLALMLLGAPGPARGQFLGAWLPAEGTVGGKAMLARSDNDTWFCGANLGHCEPGQRGNLSDLVLRERSRVWTLLGQVEATPWPFLSFVVQVPFHDVRYTKWFDETTSQEFSSSGVGDLRLVARAGRTVGAWGLSGGYALQLPTGDFDISANLVPVGQGTRNHDLFLEFGRSLWPSPAYLEAGVLLRLRETFVNEFGIGIDWGNEIHGRLTGGYGLGSWWLKTDVHAFRSGERTSTLPGEPPGQFRSRLEIVPGLVYDFAGRGWADLWVVLPVAGRNTPADPAVGLSLTWRWRVG